MDVICFYGCDCWPLLIAINMNQRNKWTLYCNSQYIYILSSTHIGSPFVYLTPDFNSCFEESPICNHVHFFSTCSVYSLIRSLFFSCIFLFKSASKFLFLTLLALHISLGTSNSHFVPISLDMICSLGIKFINYFKTWYSSSHIYFIYYLFCSYTPTHES